MPENVKPVIELELYIVRHGNSRTNAGMEANTLEEQCNPYLTDFGEKQIELLGKRFANLALDRVFSSGLRRALKTANAVIKYQPESGAHKIEVLPCLTEWGIPEEYEGKTMEEIQSEFPCAVPAGGTEGYTHFIDCTSSTDIVYEKAKKAICDVRNRFHDGEKVMIAGHGCLEGYMIYAALGIEAETDFFLSLYNTGITKIVFYKEGTGPVTDVQLVYLNDHSHLLEDYPTFSFDKL